jgi:hypothetical protein
MGAILTSRETSSIASGHSVDVAFVDGFSSALHVAAIVAFVGAVTAAILIRRSHPPEPTAVVEGATA